MAAKLERTATPGIFRRHSGACPRSGRCDCSYVVVWRRRGKQATQTFRTFAEAREAKGSRDAGDSRPTSREPFADYARCWITTYRGRTARGLADRTRRTYERDMERWAIPYFRGSRLDEVEPPDIRAFIGHLEAQGLRPASVRAILAPVKAMYATAVEDGTVRANPTRNVRVGIERDQADAAPEVRALTRAELTRLLGHVPERWRLLIELLAHTGLRISEAIALTWGDVEFGERPRLLIRRQDCRGEVGALKSEASRRNIPLAPRMAERLWTLGADSPGNARIFTSPQGLPVAYGNLRRRVLVPATVAAGLPWVTFHTFRHTCASLLFEAGRDVKQVAAWLGHADAAFTLRTYVHLMDDGVGDAAFLDDAILTTQTPHSARVNAGSTEGTQTVASRVVAIGRKRRD